MPLEVKVRFFRLYGTFNPCQTGKDIPTAEWPPRGPTHLHKNIGPASQAQCLERWLIDEMRNLIQHQ
jgi:hypothetical protein